MTITQTIIMGITEGLTEFLPISSTGHMILVSHLMNILDNDFLKTFEICIQVGAIMAVVVLYFNKLWDKIMIQKLIVGFIPTGILGFFLYKYIKTLLGSPLVVAGSLLLGGIIILVIEKWYSEHLENGDIPNTHAVSYPQAIVLGLCQSLALIPGVSRSGAMIIGGMIMKLPRTLVVEFTFLLAIPTMVSATAYTIYKNHSTITTNGNLISLFIGTFVAFIVALFVIKYFLNYIRTKSFNIFGWYRIALALVVFIALIG